MAKKLTVEVDAETAKAKRKLQELAETGGSAAGADAVGSAAQRATRSLDNAAGAANRLSKSIVEGTANLRAMTKVFGGMAISMAANYAAQTMEPGSKEQRMIQGVGNVASGAMAGSAFGPVGMIAGASMGLATSIFDNYLEEYRQMNARSKTVSDNLHTMKMWDETRKRTLAFRETLESLNNVETKLAERQKLLAEEIKKREEADFAYAKKMVQESEDSQAFQLAMSKRQANLSEIDALKNIQKKLEEEQKRLERLNNEQRSPIQALDSLARVGGNFTGGESAFRDLQRVNEKQVALLEKIEAKTGKGAGTF